MNDVLILIIAILIIFLGTTLGSAFVYFIRSENLSDRMSNMILGFASGVMFAAAIFGLLLPSIEEASSDPLYENWAYVPPLVGFIVGCLFLYLLDKIVPHFHPALKESDGIKTNKLSDNVKFLLAVTIHNIPEGLAVGFAAGIVLTNPTNTTMFSLLSLAIGIAIQNIPEGLAVSFPFYTNGLSKTKSFLLGVLTGVVEPLFAVIGMFVSSYLIGAMPWFLAFASGAMIYVTIDELLPESRKGKSIHFGVWAFMIGFLVMMTLEMVLG